MTELFDQIAWAANHGAYFLALSGALVVPDICAALESPDGESKGERYKKWFDDHVAAQCYGMFDGEACWRFRCSLLHQGTTQHDQSPYSRIMFVEPGATTHVIHMNVVNDALIIDVREFSLQVVAAAKAWEAAAVGTEPYDTNVTKFLTRYANGLAPYIVGVPVIS